MLAATDGPEAVRLVEEHPEGIDFVLLDVVMPGFGGQKVLAKIREGHPSVRALFVSGYSEDDARGRLDPREPLLRKPHDPVTLLQRVREVLDGEVGPERG